MVTGMSLEVTKEEIKQIPTEDIKTLQAQLHDLDTKWADKLADKIQKKLIDDGSEERCNRQKIYNICNEIITHNRWRVLFVLKGNELKKELITEQNQAIDEIQNPD